ncbi:hypothetical protein BTJ68_02926 [Hortaea werneckii EXF-2000]|uniref:Cation efflux protein transmembrane domain-containing protein n=2 Tax=Hortaea werneckii TaxID=91943 RepID=A0A3M7ILW0_HORWE|nr:hypothetical protein BTJ68_02926 [Hortaea werneckii EXF-2000]RMZ26333.1 hypothetical protein D0859_09607 [Hortaea werneckii]
MPLPRLSTCSLPCRNTSLLERASHKKKSHLPLQRRVLTYIVGLGDNQHAHRGVSRLRSPHQWSHIAHHSRNPAATALRPSKTIMSVDAQKNAQQVRTHMGHSHHGHHHHHDNTYLTSQNKNDPGVRITRIGLYVNLGMAIAKGAGGYVFNSQALTADAVHALTDLVSDITTLATISYSLKAATSRFPLGYGKVESLGALGVSGLLLSGGIMIGLQAILALCQQFFPELGHTLSHLGIFAHGHDHSHIHADGDLGPNINAAWLAGGSILVKEWLYRATNKVAQHKRSSVLASNAYHHRVDSLTAFVALATIVASRYVQNAQWLDPVGGLAISGMIVQAGWGNTKAALLELADVAMDDEVKENVEKATRTALSEQAAGNADLRGVQGIKSGQNYLVEIELATPPTWSVERASDLEAAVRHEVSTNIRGVRRVNVRFTSKESEHAAFADEFVAGRSSDSEEEHTHEHGHDHHDHTHAHTTSRQTNGSASKRT